MNRWLRKVHLSYGMLVFVAVVYVGMGYFPFFLYRLFGGEGAYPDEWLGDIGALGVLIWFYGSYRAAAVHPLFRTQYREWLIRTPWAWGRPLLEGPVTLVWQDLFGVGLATGVSVLHRDQPLHLMPSIFLTSYLIVWCLALTMTRQSKHAYAIALGLSGLLFVWPSAIGSLLLFGALYAIARHGIGECFQSFANWSRDPGKSCNRHLQLTSSQQKQRDRRLGWPYDVLSPKRIEDSISVGWSAALGILVGWWCFALVFLHAPAGCQNPLMASCLIAIIVGGVRLLAYLVGSSAPLSILGRVLNHRWILPRYDVALIAPLLIVLLALTMLSISSFPWIPVSILTAIVAGGSLFISLACPPGLEEWKLTGSHRIVPGIGSRISEYVETQ